ncbi:MAG: sugar-binding protein, partial [Victivallales bacterium]
AGLCVTGNGKIFIAEESAPKRFTRWSSDGTLEREFHGPYYFSGMFGIDEEFPEHVYADTHGDIIRYELDYGTGRWKVDSYWSGVYKGGDGFVSPKWWPRIRHHDGKVWWCGGSGAIVELDDSSFRYISRVYGGWLEKQADGNYKYSRKNTGFKGTWSDLNGDGREQPDEWQTTSSPAYPLDGPGPQQGWGWYFDSGFNLYTHDWSDDAKGGVWKLPVSEWKNGVPVYKWELAAHAGLNRPGLTHGAAGARSAFADGGRTYALNGGYNSRNLPGVGHGRDYEFAQISCYDEATGRPLWHAGERCATFASPGQHYCPTGAAGIVGDYLFWTDENSLVHAWDKQNGLYVDTLLEDISRAPVPSPYTVWVELFNSRVFTHPRTGKVYLLAASDAIHVYEVTGADQKMQRFSGEFQLTEKDIELAKKQLASKSGAKTRELRIAKTAAEPKLDGNPAEFAKSEAAPMVLSDDAKGTARLMIDDRNIYVCFEVRDSSPWKNGGSDISTLFKTGDEVSLWLGQDNKKRQPAEKDARIMFAPTADGRNVVVAFRPKWPKNVKPVSFKSPSGEVKMDRVEELPGAKCVVKTTAGGYVLEAAVPLSDIGLDGKSGGFGLDLSITFSDPAGQVNNARLHWGRNGAAMVYDLPSEARLEPETWGVGIVKSNE